MSYYLYAKEHGSRIYHIYIDDEGIEQREIIKDFNLTLAKKVNYPTGHKSLFGDHVEPFELPIKEFKQFLKDNRYSKEYFGMNRPIIQFLNKNYMLERGKYAKPDINKIRILNFDIETSMAPGTPFPNPKTPIVPIISLSFKMFNKDQRVTFGYYPYKKQAKGDIYVQCKDEYEMLYRSVNYIRYVNPHILTGWNCVPLTNNLWKSDKISPMSGVHVGDNLYDSNVNEVFPISNKEVYELRLANGSTIQSSIEHIFPIYSSPNGKYINDIKHLNYAESKLGDVIDIMDSNDVYCKVNLNDNLNDPLTYGKMFSENYDLIEDNKVAIDSIDQSRNGVIKVHRTNNINKQYSTFNFHEVIPQDILWMVGMIFTDGASTYKNEVRISNTNIDIIERLHLIKQVYFNSSAKMPSKSKDGCYYIDMCLSNVWLHKLFIYDGHGPRSNKRLNIELLSQLSREQFLAFYAGCVDGDGSVCNRVGAVSVCNYDGNIDTLSELLLWNGVFNTKTSNTVRSYISDQEFINHITSDHKRNGIKHGSFERVKPSKNIKWIFGEKCVYVRISDIDTTGQCVDMIDISTNTHLFVNNGITTHNCDRFDIPYFIERTRQICGSEHIEQLSPFAGEWNAVSEFNGIYSILGINIIDYLTLYKQYQFEKLPTYRLDYVGQFEGVGGKVEYHEKWGNMHNFYMNDFQGFIEYNERDVEVVELINKKQSFMELLFLITYINNTMHEDYLFATRGWDASIYHELSRDNIHIPMQKLRNEDEPKAQGAYVFDPQKGIWKWVFSIDANSLYPTIFDMLNLSPETMEDQSGANFENTVIFSELIKAVDIRSDDIVDNWKTKTIMTDFSLPQSEVDGLIQPHDPNYITAGNGVKFSKTRRGVIPKLVRNAVNERKVHNNMRKDYEAQVENGFDTLDDVMKAYLNDQIDIEFAIQLALKIFANAVYGAVLEPGFRYYEKNLGEAVTGSGRFVIYSTHGHTNKLFNSILETEGVDYILYGDTDSLYINVQPIVDKFYIGDINDKSAIIDFIDDFAKNVLTKYLHRVFQVIQRFTNANESLLHFKREAIIDRAIFVAKKRYVDRVWDNEGVRFHEPQMNYVGVETVRTTTPPWWKNKINRLFDIFFNEDEDACVKHFIETRKHFDETPFQEWCPSSGVNKLAAYRDAKSGPPHIIGSIMFNRYIAANGLVHIKPIQDSDKIKWVYLNKLGVAKYGHTALAFPDDETLVEIGMDRSFVDIERMYEKGSKPMYNLSDVAQWPTSKLEQLQQDDIFF